ncbi:MAG: glycosyltransferase [Gemmatimonadaceae bacterium]
MRQHPEGANGTRVGAAPAGDRVAISVVIPSFNREQLIARQLAALAAQRWDGEWEVIVADNGSTDHTVAVVESFRDRLPALRVVDASDHRGAGHARNVGARAARGACLLFVDDDDEVQSGWLAAMAAALERHDFVACATDYELLNPTALARARGEPQRWNLLRASYPPHLLFAGGCGLGVRRELHERVGGFDESLPVTQDNDYCYRIQLTTGKELQFVPEALIAVRCRDDGAGMFRQSVLWAKYHVLLYKRYRPRGARIERAWRLYLYHWKEWLLAVARARTREELAVQAWRFGWLAGQLIGAVAYLTTPIPE